MKKLFLTALILAAPLSVYAQFNSNTIYGDDDRQDLYQVTDAKVLKLADSTLALFQAGSVSITGDVASLQTEPYGPSNNLCKDQRFYDEQEGAFCSGSLVAPDVIMTAGHCVTDDDSCAATKFVFGFGIKTAGAATDHVPAGEVYSCKKLLGRQQENEGADWALVKLDRPVKGHQPLKLSTTPIAKDVKLCLIGHPSGLPTKVACGKTKVRDASPNGYFVANTDSYHGNSGSAVFNQETGLIEGILVRGDEDYEYRGDCQIDKVCPEDGCRGEDVTKISSVPVPKDDSVAGAPAPARVAPVGQKLAKIIAQAEKVSFDGGGSR